MDEQSYVVYRQHWRTARRYHVSDDEQPSSSSKKPKISREPKGEWNPDTGKREQVDPKKSDWYIHYVLSDKCGHRRREKVKFRRRFRIPWRNYRELVAEAREKKWFPNCEKPDAVGRYGAPLDLLILGSLRYLGRGWTFDDLQEATGISAEVHRVFFHDFCEVGATILFERWVTIPGTADEVAASMAEYAAAGFPGCIGSADATHIIMEKCYARLKNQNTGAKSSCTTRTYNITVNHRRRILHTTKGYPGSWCDKTLIRFDSFLTDIQHHRKFSDVEFELLLKPTGNQKYKGAWVMVDNGYLNWPTTVPPFKNPSNVGELRWSKWLESMRKDVECTFGILKGRFRILKTGVRVHSFKRMDNIWFTCCALHNWLLNIDGLDANWNEGAISFYQGPDGNHDRFDVDAHAPGRLPDYDPTHMGQAGAFQFQSDLTTQPPPPLPIMNVHTMPLSGFRNNLIDHFSRKWHQNEIRWPSRSGTTQWVAPESYTLALAEIERNQS